MSLMVTRPIVETSTVVGSYSWKVSGGSPTVSNQSQQEGIVTGSITTVGHPKPYKEGGNFSLSRTWQKYHRISGSFVKSGLIYQCNNWYGGPSTSLPATPTLSTFSTLNDVLSRSNPSKPIVDVPVFLVELREVPSMLLELKDLPGFFKSRGADLIDRLAKGNLSYQFGWKPFLSDLKSLLDFRQSVEDRFAYLSKLYAKGGMKFKTQREEFSDKTNSTYLGLSTPNDCVWIYTRTERKIQRWFSVSWVPNEDFSSGLPKSSQIRDRAFRSIFGLEASLAPAWEALPWSWLIDWFSDIGSFLNARRNAAGFVPGDCYTMEYTRRAVYYDRAIPVTGIPWTNFSFSNGYHIREDKTRSKGTVALPTVRLPILSLRQLGILGSITWLRAKS